MSSLSKGTQAVSGQNQEDQNQEGSRDAGEEGKLAETARIEGHLRGSIYKPRAVENSKIYEGEPNEVFK